MASTNQPVTRQFASFAEFYPFYLAEHTNLACRRLHFMGSTLTLLCLAALVATFDLLWSGGDRLWLRLRLGRPFLFRA